MQLTLLCPDRWDPEDFHYVPGLTRCYWGTANIPGGKRRYWFLLPNLFAN